MASTDSDRLSSEDAHILGLESSVITGHTLKLVVLEPGAAPLDVEALRAAVAARLTGEPRASQRVDTSGPVPRWVSDPDFDIAEHVRRRVTANCASQADLWNSLSELMSEHLDRSRPLWTFDVIGPLADGREAIAVRIHHAMADGIGAVRFLHAVLWDPHRESAGTTRAGVRPPAPRRPIAEALQMPGVVLRELGDRGSASPFDRPITGARELAFTAAPLAQLKAIGTARPARATINDVLLAVVAGGLREWLGDTGKQHLRAQVPVSLHRRDEATTDLGNRDSFINVHLPLAEADPVRRLDRINAETAGCKRRGDAQELYLLFHALGRLERVDQAVKRLAGSAREFSVSISNVPGPAAPVAVAGRRVEHLFSSSEPAVHHALRISAISCFTDIGIGLCVDPTVLPGVARLADAMERSYFELRDAVLGG